MSDVDMPIEENRVILAGLLAAFVAVLALAAGEYVGAVPRWLVGRVLGAVVLVVGVVAPQLYLAYRGVPPETSRRGVAALVLAWAAGSVLQPSVGSRIALGAALAVLVVEVGYEVYAGYRDATATRSAL